MPAKPEIHETIILGSGPAGLTAAIYAARSRCCPLLIHGGQPGGQLTTTTVIDNFPGFSQGIDGPQLMKEMEEQARRFGTRFVEGIVTRVELKKAPFKVWVDKEKFFCQTLIVATGAVPKMLGLANEWELYGRGVSVCATCDAFFYRDKEVVVVGGGDTAMEEAVFLTRFARQVTVVHRRDTLRATLPLQELARRNPKITFRWNALVEAILGDREQGVQGVRIRDRESGATEELACDGLFIAIGHTPNTSLFAGQLDMDSEGYLVTGKGTETNVPGVFAAGDVQDPDFRQAITAAGSGCMAALQAERYLETLPQEESP
ncbi:thioredoxin-disulfide reductase [Desulfuromonas soudanensis]|uniref:Thioredoxin reductase n=1 Tax=Desulfuromonas soudanensis TaxID=1603606 RepID=A0A0M4D516_9BACT|nr:thioredoxin-disulfide reductase [Desulfuromonas soudanensis]ALC17864.1 thioredoxin-disulfide reductase [Desulfuromonas soudanensis]